MPKVENEKRAGLLSRIDALLRLSDDKGATPDEAAAAAAAAQRLMQKYQITQLEAEAKGEQNRAQFGNEEVALDYKGLLIDAKRLLFHGCAHACYCVAVSRAGRPGMYLLGRSENREAAKLMYLRLELELLRQAAVDAVREKRLCERTGKGFVGVSQWKNRFGWGAAMTVRQRLEEYRKQLDRELKADAPASQALMVVEDTALREFMEREIGGTRGHKYQQRERDEAFERGVQVGGSMDLGLQRKLGGN